VLGTTLDAVPVPVAEPVAAAPSTRAMPVEDGPVTRTRTRRSWFRRRSAFADDADAPVSAEDRAQQRAAARQAEPPMVTVGRNADDVEE